jgi:RNAse (barnase) inhibitor barstar
MTDPADHRPEFRELDLSRVATPDELQHVLYEAFDFPGYYGHNWNAFWDCISEGRMPRRLQVVGWQNVLDRLPDDARVMQECLSDLNALHPDIAVEVEWVLSPTG